MIGGRGFANLRAAMVAALLIGATAPATAQMTADVAFETGADSAVLNGSVIGDEYFDYILGAGKGQTMSATLTVTGTNGYGTAYFNILPPGSDGEAIFIGSMEAQDGSGSVVLPETGDYRVRVYLMGNDRDTGKTVGYTLAVAIR